MKRRVLWVCPRWLNPVNDGARQATHSLMTSTSNFNFQQQSLKGSILEVDLLIWSEETLSKQEIQNETLRLQKCYGVKNVFIEARNLCVLPPRLRKIIFTLGSFLFFKPMSVLPFFSKKWCIKSILGLPYDDIVFDAPHGAISFYPLLKNRNPSFVKIILRAHNLETQIWKAEIDKHFVPLKWIIAVQCYFMKIFEQKVVGAATRIACVSDSDRLLFRRFFKTAHVVTVPIGYDFTKNISEEKVHELKAWGFLGRLDWPPNHEGLVWFLNEVWPQVVSQNKEISLVIAGSGFCSERLKNLMQASENVIFLGQINQKEDFYQRINGVIIPIFYGGGTRVKAIEAVQKRKVIMSTRLGVRGLGLEPFKDYHNAEEAKHWQIQLLQIVNEESDSQMAQSAFLKLKMQFDPESFYQRWFNIFETPQNQNTKN